MVLAHHLYDVVQSHREKKKLSLSSDLIPSPELNDDSSELTSPSTLVEENSFVEIYKLVQEEKRNQEEEEGEAEGEENEENNNGDDNNNNTNNNNEDYEIQNNSSISAAIPVETLRKMFEARDVALNKLIQSTSLLESASSKLAPGTTISESVSLTENNDVKSTNGDLLTCNFCHQVTDCSFPPLQSAAAKYRKQKLSSTELLPITELEPNFTNWTSDFIGLVFRIFIFILCYFHFYFIF